MGVPATFVESDVYDLPANLQGRFDLVFTSHGVLGWLPDLERWAQVIARFLTPGGRLHLIEAHPFALIFDDARTDGELKVTYPYFQGPEPLRFEREGSYAAPDAPVRSVEHTWIHPLADVIGALLRAGLRLESFAEYPYVAWAMFPWMEERADGAWQLPGGAPALPLMFSLSASKPAS
jgi:SAM-dependent methyltransferase